MERAVWPYYLRRPLRARYSEGCLFVRNSEPKKTGYSVGSLDVPSSAPPELGDMESDPVVGLLPTVPPGSGDAEVGLTVPPTAPQGLQAPEKKTLRLYSPLFNRGRLRVRLRMPYNM